jgi:hypothetical protein
MWVPSHVGIEGNEGNEVVDNILQGTPSEAASFGVKKYSEMI